MPRRSILSAAEWEETRHEHLLELRTYLGMASFRLAHYRQAVHVTDRMGFLQTGKGIVLASRAPPRPCPLHV